ncbi:hypothetical protein ACFV9G_24640 [Nocardioides sp. NPDC059952]|uniref:hypothetical protein n=1 Tax=Nocardioides sp. NPDC059952 TaxID=3347014 RepID=UPI0036517996
MPLIDSTDPDFKVCQLDFEVLLELQRDAEARGWGTRWSTVGALRGQVKEGQVLMQSFMREQHGGGVHAYRCLVLFATAVGESAGGVATIDVDPGRYEQLPRIDRDPDVRAAYVRIFRLAMGGIEMISKN